MDPLRAPRLTTAGLSTWKATAARPRIATTTRRSAQGADDCYAAALYIQKLRGKRPLLVYGISSGALRAAMFAERHPEMVTRLALDAMVWTGEGSPTLAERKKKLPEFQQDEPPAHEQGLHSLGVRPRPSRYRRAQSDRGFCRRGGALYDSVPTGTYVDMCSRLPVVDPEKITVPTLIMRGQHDGIASMRGFTEILREAAQP